MTQGICPVCMGTMRKPCTDQSTREYGIKHGWFGYDADTDTVPCDNCGAQRQWGRPTGKVLLRRDNNEPCHHEYVGNQLGRCYWGYTCRHCGDHYTIDSGD